MWAICNECGMPRGHEKLTLTRRVVSINFTALAIACHIRVLNSVPNCNALEAGDEFGVPIYLYTIIREIFTFASLVCAIQGPYKQRTKYLYTHS